MKGLIVAALAALLVALVPAADADAATKKRTSKRAQVVCFKKTVKTTSGRKVRRKVCRPRRKAISKPKAVKQAPAPAAPAPVSGEGSDPSPDSPAPAAAVPAPVAGPACVPEDTEWLSVTALDVDQKFVLRLSRTCLRAGRTIVQYRNEDLQEHDLWVEGTSPRVAKREVVASAAPESLEQAEMQLGAGEWRLFCSITGHGTMSRTVTVTP